MTYSILGKEIEFWKVLGPIWPLPKSGCLIDTAEAYRHKTISEWKRIRENPNVLTKLWSIPYYVERDNNQSFVIMFSIENYSFYQFKFRTKILHCPFLDHTLKLPIRYKVEIKLKQKRNNINGDEFSSPVIADFTCTEIDQYSQEDVLIKFDAAPTDQFLGLWVRVLD